jgi:hypothetical protein
MPTERNKVESSVQQAIAEAEKLLPGVPAPDNEPDPRWQAIIEVGEYIETEPHEVWPFILKWGKHPSDDVRMAVATCLLEHLLEYHFDDFFPKVKRICRRSGYFADTFLSCSQFGQAEDPENSKAFKALKRKLGVDF